MSLNLFYMLSDSPPWQFFFQAPESFTATQDSHDRGHKLHRPSSSWFGFVPWYCPHSMHFVMVDDITSGLLGDVTMTMVTLAPPTWTDTSGLF